MKRKNHTFFILDASGSMSSLGEAPVMCLKNIQQQIIDVDNASEVDTLFSIYLFGEAQECVQFETKHFELSYDAYTEFMERHGNWTALYKSISETITDARGIFTKYGNHAFLYYIITDGEDNKKGKYDFYRELITSSDTLVYLVPSAVAKAKMIAAGVPADCIDIWDLSKKGLESATERFTEAYKSYNLLRTQGITATSNYFKLNTSNLSVQQVKKEVPVLKPSSYRIYQNHSIKAAPVKTFVEDASKKPYVLGKSYYSLVKKETIQSGKEVILINRSTGKAYCGLEARTLIGLPNTEVKLQPGDFGDWDIYIQSTSVNRNIIPNQYVLVLN